MPIAEDGSWVPLSYYADDPKYQDRVAAIRARRNADRGTLGGRVRQSSPVRPPQLTREDLDEVIHIGSEPPPEDFTGFLWFDTNEFDTNEPV